LYYRLNVIPLHTPPLRNRLDDLDLLVDHFTDKYCSLFGKKRISIPRRLMEKMRQYDWPGNIRELENAVEYLVNMSAEDGTINEAALHSGFLQPSGRHTSRVLPSSGTMEQPPVVPLQELERQAILRALAYYGDSSTGKKQAAKALGISLATLYRKLK
jgi:transcriptional regulator with PAS, ATPase and Fis domain